MGLHFIVLTSLSAPELGAMTFPRYRPLLASADANVLAMAAMDDRKPVALVLVRPGNGENNGELLSLYVAAARRRQGVGRRLLAALETELQRRGGKEIHTVWMNGTEGSEGFATLLHKQGWSPPRPRMIVYRAELERLSMANWIHAFAVLPPGYAIVPWSSLDDTQLTTLRQAIRFEGWVPAELVPFDFVGRGIDGAPSEPTLNLACTVWGDVVGWNFAHRINEQTVRVSCTFVRPDLQQQLLMLALWREVFIRQVATAYRSISWAVASERESMVGFNDKYMGPYLSRRAETWGSQKRFGQ